MVPNHGIKPCPLQCQCSVLIVLLIGQIWCIRRDSNSRPPRSKRGRLSPEIRMHIIGGPGGTQTHGVCIAD